MKHTKNSGGERGIGARLMRAACLAACVGVLGVDAATVGWCDPVEPLILPTAYPVLEPSSMITLPLMVQGNNISVWARADEQRIMVSNAVIQLAYRTLYADQAVVYLTPSNDGGENAYDAAIYLAGNARVEEGVKKTSTVSTGNVLMVTSRVPRNVQLVGTPVSRAEEDNPLVMAGLALRDKLENQPMATVFVPNVTVTDTENALQRGWIARGPGNRIIAGPGELVVALPGGGLERPTTPAPAPPRPTVFATGDKIEVKKVDGEQFTLMRGGFYLLRTTPDGKPPLELRAQRAVLFSPDEKNPTTRPAGSQQVARAVTGVYLEGDVTVDTGEQTIRAERVFYDFTSNRAIMLDAVLSTVDEQRNVPLYMRASSIRQTARGQFAAKDASFSTSEFNQPHYNIGASNVYLQDVTAKDDTGKNIGPAVYDFRGSDTTVDVRGVPIFYWPFLSARTDENDIPLRRLKISNSSTYGLSLETGWDIFALAGVRHPQGWRARLDLDYFGKRGPAGGIQLNRDTEDSTSELHTFIQDDQGSDQLSFNRDGVPVAHNLRGRLLGRDSTQLDDNWTLQLQGSYISDVNYLEQFFGDEFDSDSENETSIYLKYERGTEGFSFLGKTSLYDFVSNADLIDDQFTTQKAPEVKYWRTGDSILGLFTYYSESGVSDNKTLISNHTPNESSLETLYTGLPANLVLAGIPANETFRQYYQSKGWTTNDVVRGDTRQELDLPLQIGDLKVAPYVTGRLTGWDNAFPESASGDTSRIWGQVGVRGSMAFWKVYDDADSQFFDVHRIRHVIEPEFTVYETGSDVARQNLQPFDYDVEGISNASGGQLALHQKWQTKRGGVGHFRNVDWIELNVSGNAFWNKDAPGLFYPRNILTGYIFSSRPDLSLVSNSINADATWRIGERVRFLADESYNTDTASLTTLSSGFAVDANPQLSYFVGNRYVGPLDTDEWTFATGYQLTRKYSITATESYDFGLTKNILTQFSVQRKLPRFNIGLTTTYDANQGDTSVVFTAWPEGFPELGVGSGSLKTAGQ